MGLKPLEAPEVLSGCNENSSVFRSRILRVGGIEAL